MLAKLRSMGGFTEGTVVFISAYMDKAGLILWNLVGGWSQN